MNTIKPFFAFVRRVLPAVYDDSLSYYEQLARLVAKLNEVINTTNGITDEFNQLVKLYEQLKNYVDTYFDNLDVQNEINNKLDQMAENGTLRILFNVWGEPNEDIERYRKESLANIASYLINCYGCDSVENSPVMPANQVCWKYNTNKGYMALFGRYLKFVYTDKQETPNGNLPVAYADCAVFTSLINKCISFADSPYFYTFNTPNPDIATLYAKSFESGGTQDKPWTYDFLNNYNTSKMAYINQSTGVGLVHLSHMERGDSYPTIKNAQMIKSGDMVYRATSESANLFKGVNHCGTFVKNLGELNTEAGLPTSVIFKAYNGKVSNIGYVVEFTGSTGQTDYKNTMRISAIEDWCEWKISENDWVDVYFAKPISCSLTSNKARSILTGNVQCYDFDIDVLQERTESGGYQIAKINSKIAGGVIIQDGTDLNDIVYDGVYQCSTSSSRDTLSNVPNGTAFDNFTLVCTGFNNGGVYGNQICIGFSESSYQYIAIRCKTNVWSPWVFLNTLTENSENTGVKECCTGLTNSGSIPANSYKDIVVSYPFNVENVSRIEVTQEILSSVITPPYLKAYPVNGTFSKTGFKLRVFNTDPSAAHTGYFRWFAFNAPSTT